MDHVEAESEGDPEGDKTENVPQSYHDARRMEARHAAGEGAVQECDRQQPSGEVDRRVRIK